MIKNKYYILFYYILVYLISNNAENTHIINYLLYTYSYYKNHHMYINIHEFNIIPISILLYFCLLKLMQPLEKKLTHKINYLPHMFPITKITLPYLNQQYPTYISNMNAWDAELITRCRICDN